MSVTKQNIANYYGINVGYVEQVGSKQLFTTRIDNCTVLISYYTIIGRLIGGIWYITTHEYSRTTTRQIKEFAIGERVQYVDDINNFTLIDETNANGSK